MLRARAPRRSGDNRSLRYRRALQKREAAFLRCKAVLTRASPGPHYVGWRARVARLCATALAFSGMEAQHARLLRARAAPHWRQSFLAPWKGTAQAITRPSSLQGRAPTCQPWPALRGVACACSTLVRHTALALSWEEAQHGLRRARAPRWSESVRFLRKTTAPARSLAPSVQGRALSGHLRLSTCSPLSCDRARPRHSAGSIW